MQGNISGGGRGRQNLSNVDFYRRVPKDLTEATNLGAVMSVFALLLMTVLFLSETYAFIKTDLITSIEVDPNSESTLRLNFNLTLPSLHCDYVSVDVWDSLGTNRQNVTQTVERWQLDEDGRRRIFAGRNRETRELKHEDHEETLEEMQENGAHDTVLTEDTFDEFVKGHDMAFVDMYAPWCVWCQRLLPTWEKFAEEVHDKKMPVGVGSVNCVEQAALCRSQRVMAFPTIRWFANGEASTPDYKMDRTVSALVSFAKRKLESDARYKEWENKAERETDGEKSKREARQSKKASRANNDRPDYPGCQVSGYLMVNRVPGNFHIEAKSKSQNLNAAMTNLTHRVNHLSFGEPDFANGRKMKRTLKRLPEEHTNFAPMDGSMYAVSKFHGSYHHYIKVVSTHLNLLQLTGAGGGSNDDDRLVSYQFLRQSQVVHYEEDQVPTARFSYDLSPMSVIVEREGRQWYDYLTSLCAIVGGTFTTLGLIDAVLYKCFKAKKA